MDAAEREKFAAFVMRMRGAGLDRRELVEAVEATPRSAFVPAQWSVDAWCDRSIPIECGQTIESLDLQMRVLAALDLRADSRVLEIGCGSGFTAAIMARLCARVLSLDRFRTLCEQATQRCHALGLANVLVRQADGAQGLPAEGPFDRIIVWAAYEALPRGFVDQLSSSGVMVATIGPGEDEQMMEKLTKVGSRFEREQLAQVRFQPIAAGVAQAI